MIKCNLATLLAERGLKITKVSQDTGISRTTLTALSSNTSQGIQFDTINKLCQYLKTDINSFFIFHPSDIEYTLKTIEDIVYINLSITYKNQIYSVLMRTHLREFTKESSTKYELTVSLVFLDEFPEYYKDNIQTFDYGNDWFSDYYGTLPIIFKTDFEQKLLSELKQKLNVSEKADIIFNINPEEFINY
ncbi:MAG: helix-turn-helix domain-containing protein [Peptoanaerobacter stomatis]|uniref:helix-turn-helix domain-containing protein n=1 Tax=Peptoanaerobacter stomatis TaxID=796937 RepID=UPI003FA12A59